MNRWRVAFWVMALIATGIFALWTREYAKRVIAEIPSSIDRAIVVLYPGGHFLIEREGMGADVQVFTSGEVIVHRRFPPLRRPRKLKPPVPVDRKL